MEPRVAEVAGSPGLGGAQPNPASDGDGTSGHEVEAAMDELVFILVLLQKRERGAEIRERKGKRREEKKGKGCAAMTCCAPELRSPARR